jgi:4-hydroxybenzoate polyprenyltransferase
MACLMFQDIPDVEGDKVFGIHSFSVRLGQKRVFWLCVWLLQAAYTTAVVVGLTSSTLWTKVVMVISLAFFSLSKNHYLTPRSCCPLKTSEHQITVEF